jgi:altronate hydrolase
VPENPIDSMKNRILRVDDRDNVLIALTDLRAGEQIEYCDESFTLVNSVPQKHKLALHDLAPGDPVVMYGVKVGTAVSALRRGELVTTRNIRHDAAPYSSSGAGSCRWRAPDVSKWAHRTFLGYHRSDGQVGTRNYWVVVPLVFCENRNLSVLKQALEEEIGFVPPQIYRRHVAELAGLYRAGEAEEIKNYRFEENLAHTPPHRLFENLDGIKFLTHPGGCGGTREDADNLCGLLAGYLHHPNVAGATVLSLGCQNAQVSILRQQLRRRAPGFDKPLFIFEQQQCGSESVMLSGAIRETFLGLIAANQAQRRAAPLSHLCLGLKCGGSDGFSGLSANPAIGYAADLLAALGGRGILAEFPELCGAEQELINRCVRKEVAGRFVELMEDYAARAKAVRSGFDMNPSPGNIRDGLVTDAMKSAGAARKGGSSPVTDVLDYPEYSSTPGLNLLCTPGNDVECVTAQVAAGANLVLFTTGLGTPTGNPIAPVVKISSNSALAERMADIIDVDTGGVISGDTTIAQAGEAILDFVVKVASGEIRTKAELSGQDDFLPWKRGVSL